MKVNNKEGESLTTTTAVQKQPLRRGAGAVLTPAAAALAGASISENTRLAYQSALDRLQAFLQEQGQALAGLTDRQLAEYLGALHEAGASPASASLACAAVRFLAKSTGQPSPAGPLTDRVSAGIRRKGKDRGRGQVSGIQWSQADTAAAIASNGDQDLAGLRDAAILALMSDCLLRVSEATAIEVDHLALEADGTGRLTIEHSKTDQEGAGAVLFVGAPTVSRLRAWMTAAGIESGPLFRRVRRGGLVGAALHCPLRPSGRSSNAAPPPPTWRAISQATASESESAQSLASQGASLVEMQNAGRWQSPAMPGHYARGEFAARGSRCPAPVREVSLTNFHRKRRAIDGRRLETRHPE